MVNAETSRRQRRPDFRCLRVYAFDPSLNWQLDTATINEMALEVRWEDLAPGPIGEYLEVIDVDPASRFCYAPVDLNDPYILAQNGLAPIEADPQFHQQMTYAVAMTTIRNFERALGHSVLWSGSGERGEKFVRRLRVYPHAVRDANAYYSPQKKALLFGYFPASSSQPGRNLPGGPIFTCLSHDVIAHETTHALLDGIHREFIEPANPDSLALHEAFADIIALLQHFTFPEALRDQIRRTRGDLGQQSLLGQLAQQFGQAIGNYGALRDALGTVDTATGKWHPKEPDPSELLRTKESHARGAILLAAIFEAFISVYRSRIADLLRIATAGTGVLPEGDIHPDLIERMAHEASIAASHILNIVIRALNYCPPVDVTFGDYLRALVSVDSDLMSNDDRRYRIAIIESFRRRGIYPDSVRSLAAESLCWEEPSREEKIALEKLLPKGRGMRWLQPNWLLTPYREKAWKEMRHRSRVIHSWLRASKYKRAIQLLGINISTDAPFSIERDAAGVPVFEVHSIRPARRLSPDNRVISELIIEITQARKGYLNPKLQERVDSGEISPPPNDFWLQGGCTVVLDLDRRSIRYLITKNIASQVRLVSRRKMALASSQDSY